MNILEKMFMRFSLEERRKHLCNTLRERGELQALNTDELGFVFMCVKIEYEHRKNKTWMFFFLFMFFFVNFGSSFLLTLGTVCYHWNGYPPHEQEAIGLCLFLLGFFWRGRGWGTGDQHLQKQKVCGLSSEENSGDRRDTKRKKKEIGCKFIFGTILYKRKQYHLAGSLFQGIRCGCESTRWTAYPETDVQFLTFFTVDSGVLRCP